MTDILPSFQRLEDSDTKLIFLRPDGTNWQIFVEAGGITGGFRLRRLLKKAGAAVCSDPRQSQVILVDSSTTEGRLFIRDWGKDENKVVLEYSWVNGCISEGRVLDENDNWGGFLTQDDGLPVSKEEPDDMAKSPLPTPRDTPDEVTSSRRRPEQGKQFVEPLAQTSATGVPQSPSPTGAAHSAGSNFPSNPQHDVPPYQFMSAQPIIQPGLNPSLGYSNDQVQAWVEFLNQQSDPRTGAQYTPFTVATAMSGAAGAWPWGPLPEQNAQAIPPQMLNSQGHGPPFYSTVFSPDISHPAQLTDLPYQDASLSPTLPPSIRRKSPAVSRSSSESPTSKGKRRSRGMSDYPPSSAPSSSAPRRTSASRQSSTQTGTLFTSQTGKELSFFVQIDLKDRSLTTNAIKKNGGILRPDHATADYSVLYSRSTTFKDLRRSTHAAGRPAVSASFVHDCVRQNTVLDPSPYLFPLPASKLGKRKRQENHSDKQSTGTTRTKKSRKKALQVEPSEPQKEDNPLERKIKPKEEHSSPALKMIPLDNDRSRPRSPTPPPTHSHVQLSGGGFKYSEEEREYALRYVEVLLERDHQMPMSTMAGNLFRKMSNHSLASWKTFLVRTIRDDIESIRKRKSIAYRKAQGNRKQLKTEQSQDLGWDKGLFTSSPSPTLVSDPGSDRKDDLETISRFFATRQEEEEEDDAAVWACLTSHAACRTAASWEEFYTKHHEEVTARFNKLTNPVPEDISRGPNLTAVRA